MVFLLLVFFFCLFGRYNSLGTLVHVEWFVFAVKYLYNNALCGLLEGLLYLLKP